MSDCVELETLRLVDGTQGVLDRIKNRLLYDGYRSEELEIVRHFVSRSYRTLFCEMEDRLVEFWRGEAQADLSKKEAK